MLLFTNLYCNYALLVMYCMCLLAVIITSADIRKLWVQCICMLFTNMLPEAICCCLQTCYIYGVLLTLPCTYIPTFMATTANIRSHLAYLLINCLRLFVVVYKPVTFMVSC